MLKVEQYKWGQAFFENLAEGTVTGVIKVNSGAAEADMDQAVAERKSLLITMAEQVAMAVTNLRLREQLRQQAIKDPLTGLYNRRRLEETLLEELSWAERHDETVGVIMLDVDHFKQLNDTHGHETGDAVLRELGGLLNRSLRREDRAFRYGGEEFTLVILKTNAERLCRLAELVRVRVEEELNLSLFTESIGKVTVSLGAAQFPDHARDLHGLLQAADEALYLAKHRGRNRVAFAAKAASEE
ncbi:MAG: diguanylate cyclase [Desulfohalobiaceae bacterium]